MGDKKIKSEDQVALSGQAKRGDVLDHVPLETRPVMHVDRVRYALRQLIPEDAEDSSSLKVIYRVSWDLFQILKNKNSSGQELRNILTLTGDGVNAQASSCGDYISKNWPRAACLIQKIQNAFNAIETGMSLY